MKQHYRRRPVSVVEYLAESARDKRCIRGRERVNEWRLRVDGGFQSNSKMAGVEREFAPVSNQDSRVAKGSSTLR